MDFPFFTLTYIGSFEVTGETCRKKRFEFVRQQLEDIRHFIARGQFIENCKLVLFIISNSGVKVCSLDEKVVHMTHALKRISYATCDPDYFLFAFVARESTTAIVGPGPTIASPGPGLSPGPADPSPRPLDATDDNWPGSQNSHNHNKNNINRDDQYQFSQTHRQYCHVYRTDSKEKAEEINAAISKAFRAAYVSRARQSLLLEQTIEQPNFENGPIETPCSEKSLVDDQIQVENLHKSEQQSLLFNCPCSPIKNGQENGTSLNHVTSDHVILSPETTSNYVPVVRMRVKKPKNRNLVSTASQCTDINSNLAPENCQNSNFPGQNGNFSGQNSNFSYQNSNFSGQNANFHDQNSNFYNKSQPFLAQTSQNMQIRHLKEEKKRRPLSAAFLFLNKKEKNSHSKTFINNFVNNSHVTDVIQRENGRNLHNKTPSTGCFLNEDDSSNRSLLNSSYPALSSNQNEERLLLDNTNNKSFPMANQNLHKHKRLSATFGSSFFKRLFGGSTWRLNTVPSNEGSEIKDEKTTSKKRRPLSAVFAGSSSNGVSSGTPKTPGSNSAERKRQSIFGLKSANHSRNHVETCQSEFQFERVNERRSKSVMNLDNNIGNLPNRRNMAASNGRITSSGEMISAEKSDSLLSLTADEERKLIDAAWFVDQAPKEVIQKVLNSECVGSFVVRRSNSQKSCLALTVRVPNQHNSTGVSHYLILRTEMGFRLKGFSKDFPSVHALVTHHSIMPEQLPCRLVFTHRDEAKFQLAAQDLAENRQENCLSGTATPSTGENSGESIMTSTTMSDDADSAAYGVAMATAATVTTPTAQLRRYSSNIM